LVVEFEGGTRQTYLAGQGFVEDAGMWINNWNPGATTTELVGVIIGMKGKAPVVFPDN
jgi:hypothetical protein